MKQIVALLFVGLMAGSVGAQEAPDVLVKRVTDEVLEIVRQDKDIQSGNTKKAIELVDAKVLPHFNFQHMTTLAVGKEWKKATQQQQQQLTAEFKTLMVRTYSNSLTAYKNQKVVYKPLKVIGDAEVTVHTEIQQPGSQAVHLDYSLEKLDGGWKVYDVVVAGISLVTNYRDSFGQEIRNGGIDGLIQSVANKNKSLEAKAEKK